MIQDIEPHVYSNAYKIKKPGKESIVLYYRDHMCLIKKEDDHIEFPLFKDMEERCKNIYDNATYLFSVDDKEFYLVEDAEVELQNEFKMEDVFAFRHAHPHHMCFAGVTGFQLYNWYKDHVYCGRCGEKLVKDKSERMLYCNRCHNMVFPKLCPAVIIAVTDNERIVLSKYAGGPYKKFALLAGYSEIGETLEETVKREVFEETGLKVKNIRYYKSQPWSFSDSVLMGFFCDLDGDDKITIQENELSFAGWFDRKDIPVKPTNDSLTNEMIMAFKNGIDL